jgi:hypothetical protein
MTHLFRRHLNILSASVKGSLPVKRLTQLAFAGISCVLLLTACSEYNKALKSTDAKYKMQVAEKYMAKESWDRAIPLLEELIVLTRGTAEEREGELPACQEQLRHEGLYHVQPTTWPTSCAPSPRASTPRSARS